jgi:monoamine oxidase
MLVLGAGLAGMLAAYELTKAGYKVQVLEFQGRTGEQLDPARRRHGDRDWRRHAEGGLCARQLPQPRPGAFPTPPDPAALLPGTGVELNLCADQHQRHDPFGQGVWRGAQRHRELAVDFNGHVAELMVKAANAGALDNTITRADKEKLLIAMREWGILDKSDRYTSSIRFRIRAAITRPPAAA